MLTLVNGGWGISYEIALRWTPQDLSDDKSTLVQVMACCPTAPMLSQYWPRSMSPYGVTRPQWVKIKLVFKSTDIYIHWFKMLRLQHISGVFRWLGIRLSEFFCGVQSIFVINDIFELWRQKLCETAPWLPTHLDAETSSTATLTQDWFEYWRLPKNTKTKWPILCTGHFQISFLVTQ